MASNFDELNLDLRTTGCQIPADQRTRIQEWISMLLERIECPGECSLALHVAFHPASDIFNAEFKLRLPGRSLMIREKDSYMDSVLGRGFRRLMEKVEAIHQQPKTQAATSRSLLKGRFTNVIHAENGPLAQAAYDGDYRSFRDLLAGYEGWLNRRAGRLVQRSPEVQALVGRRLPLRDIVEEVFLQAFEQFGRRPTEVSLSEWLEGLIEPSIRDLMQDLDEEKAAVSFARTVRETRGM